MSWDFWLGILGTAASCTGLAWNRERVKTLAFIFMALLGATFVVRGVLHKRVIDGLEAQIASTLGTSVMTADQLYANLYIKGVTSPDFDAALSRAVHAHRLAHRMIDIRTPDNVYIKVRVYFTPATTSSSFR